MTDPFDLKRFLDAQARVYAPLTSAPSSGRGPALWRDLQSSQATARRDRLIPVGILIADGLGSRIVCANTGARSIFSAGARA
jgi:hypothetical protein